MKLQRVNKSNPCTACGHDSWCLLGETAALCMRVSSERPYAMKDGSTGYWHSFDSRQPRKWVPREDKPARKIDAEAMIKSWVADTSRAEIVTLATNLHVSTDSLYALSACWSDEWQSWAFPMRDFTGKICGIRLRYNDGRKLAVTGSEAGLFIPRVKVQPIIYACEGPTDCAALVSLGLFAVGRPSCSGGSLHLKNLMQRLGTKKLVVLADNDRDRVSPSGTKYNPGMDGAKSLTRVVTLPACVITLPTKDVREFVHLGGNVQDILDLEQNAIYENQDDLKATG